MLPPQRDDVAALRGRLEAIEAELDDVQNQARRLAALEREKARLEAERADVASRLGAYAYGEPPELEDVRVASPCKADWAAMVGTDQVRFCLSCQKHVYNLSGMSRGEATALIRESEGGEICVRMYKRADGTVMTSDCPEGSRRKRRRLALLGAGGGVVAAAAAALWPSTPACGLGQGEPVLMGSVAVLPALPPPDAPASPGGDARPEVSPPQPVQVTTGVVAVPRPHDQQIMGRMRPPGRVNPPPPTGPKKNP